MNENQRKRMTDVVNRAESVHDMIGNLIDDLQSILDEEQEKYDNLPEGLQCSSLGESIQDAIDDIQTSIDELEDMDVMSAVENILQYVK